MKKCQMCDKEIEERLLSDGLCPSCHEEVHDMWLRDPLAYTILQRVRPQSGDDGGPKEGA